MIISSKIYKGIEYVEFAELPQPQREKILETFNRHLFIKILVDGEVISRCIQYKDYCLWYNSVFSNPALAETKKVEEVTIPSEKLIPNTIGHNF